MSVLNTIYTAIENAVVRRVRNIEAEIAVSGAISGKTPSERLIKLDELRLNPFVMFV